MRVQVWPIGLFVVFILFACIVLSMVAKASSSFEGPEDDRYYENGLNYEDELQREARQARLGWKVSTDVPSLHTGRVATVAVRVVDASGQPLRGAHATLVAARPATRAQDRTWTLAESSPGLYQAAVSLAGGMWDLRLDVARGRDDYRTRTRCSVP